MPSVRRRPLVLAGAVASAALLPALGSPPSAARADSGSAATVGRFLAPFEEGGVGANECTTTAQGKVCKPVGASVVVLADGRILYWNALGGTENVQANTVLEYGDVAANDQSRVLDLSSGTPVWSTPSPADGGANPNGQPGSALVPGVTDIGGDPNQHNDGALFCADQVQLANGDVLAAGGTNYYEEPQVPGTTFGVSELEGLKNVRIFHPADNTWTQTGSMNYGRWYPSLVTLPDGKILVAGGVTKLIKPVYPDRPTDSGTNVEETETYDPATGRWTVNPASANHSFPLFPRLHLLPDGKVFYDGAGQAFNPDGQSYDEATWNIDAVYDPASQSWSNAGIPGIGTASPGFRGSAFSIMLPLKPPYTQASFLSAGGVLGVTPGSYVAVDSSEINTVDTSQGDSLTTTATGNLNNARWYSSGVALPDGTVMAFSGANRDEVDAPGSGNPVHQAELFDPATNTWTAMASASHDRTYHNTAVLLPDGSVLTGGHAPIPTAYGFTQTLPGGFSNNSRDPSFEIYQPPYFFKGARPVIDDNDPSVPYGGTFTIETHQASSIQKVMLARDTSLTHLVDGDQRTVELPIVHRDGDSLTVAAPPRAAVAPAGPYMLFIDAGTAQGLVPSVASHVFVGTEAPGWAHPALVRSAPRMAASVTQPASAPAPVQPVAGGGAMRAAVAADAARAVRVAGASVRATAAGGAAAASAVALAAGLLAGLLVFAGRRRWLPARPPH